MNHPTITKDIQIYIQHTNKKGWSFDTFGDNEIPYGSGYRSSPQAALQSALTLAKDPSTFKEPDYYDEPAEWDISILITNNAPALTQGQWSYDVLVEFTPFKEERVISSKANTPEEALGEALDAIAKHLNK